MRWLCLLFLVACAGSGGVIEDAHVGKEGMTALFVNPLRTVQPNQRVGFTVELSNEGASDADGVWTMSTNPLLLTLHEPTAKRFSMRGRTPFSPVGDKELLTFRGQARFLAVREQSAETTVRFSMCYNYQTKATVSVCLDSRPTDDQEKPCSPGPVSPSNGQGAPVSVTFVDTQLIPGEKEGYVEPRFIIHAQNIGNGVVLNPGNFNPCQAKPTSKSDFGDVTVQAVLASQPLQCEALRLDSSGQGKFRCALSQGIQEQAAYQSPLTITLSYAYFDTVLHNLIIEK